MKRLMFFAILVLVVSQMFSSAAIKRSPQDLLRQSQEAFEAQDFDKSIRLLDLVIKDNPKLGPAYVLRGYSHGAKNHLDEAVADFGKAIEINPDDERLYVLRAATYQQKKDFDKAIADFSEVIRRNPNDSDALCSRGLCQSAKGDEEKAMADFDQAIKVNGRSTAAFQLRGSAYAAKGEKEKALADFKQAQTIDAKNPMTYLYRAHLYLVENEPERALEDFQELLKIGPDLQGVNNDYAWTLATNPKDSVRDGKKAVEHALKACKATDYKHAPNVDTLAAAYAEAGDWDNAVKWQQEAVTLAEKTLPEEVQGMKDRLAMFQDKKPFRETPKREQKP